MDDFNKFKAEQIAEIERQRKARNDAAKRVTESRMKEVVERDAKRKEMAQRAAERKAANQKRRESRESAKKLPGNGPVECTWRGKIRAQKTVFPADTSTLDVHQAAARLLDSPAWEYIKLIHRGTPLLPSADARVGDVLPATATLFVSVAPAPVHSSAVAAVATGRRAVRDLGDIVDGATAPARGRVVPGLSDFQAGSTRPAAAAASSSSAITPLGQAASRTKTRMHIRRHATGDGSIPAGRRFAVGVQVGETVHAVFADKQSPLAAVLKSVPAAADIAPLRCTALHSGAPIDPSVRLRDLPPALTSGDVVVVHSTTDS